MLIITASEEGSAAGAESCDQEAASMRGDVLFDLEAASMRSFLFSGKFRTGKYVKQFSEKILNMINIIPKRGYNLIIVINLIYKIQ